MSEKTREAPSSTSENVFFSVLDVTDGRRYKVFLRLTDIPKLKISKIRKTISSIAQKPPFSFELCLNGDSLSNMEEMTCGSLGITPDSVLLMRPVDSSPTAERETRMEPVANREAYRTPSPIEDNPLDKTLSPSCGPSHGVVRSRISCTMDSGAPRETLSFSVPYNSSNSCDLGTSQKDAKKNETNDVTQSVIELSERQRVLQAELYEEAKRSQFFAPSTPAAGNGDLDEVADESANDTFINEIIGQQVSTVDMSELMPQVLTPSTQENEVASPRSVNSGVLYSSPVDVPQDFLSQGADYYGMYKSDSLENKSCTYSSFQTPCQTPPISSARYSGPLDEDICPNTGDKNNDVKNKGFVSFGTHSCEQERSEHRNKKEAKKNSFTPGTLPETIPMSPRSGIHACREEELAALVELLQDDVNNLLALHVRSESVKRALQRSLSDALERARRLEEEGQSARDQLDALISLHAKPSSNAENVNQLVSVENIRAAAVNTAAAREVEVLRQGNAALERRLVQEIGRRREISMTLEDLKGHIRVIVRVRPPMRFLSATIENGDTAMRTRVDDTRMILDNTRQTVTLTSSVSGSTRSFDFYRVCEENTRQEEIFSEIAPLVQLACDGVNISVLAYGQTGSGKTHTILGCDNPATMSDKEFMSRKDEENGELECGGDGILQRTLRVLFRRLASDAAEEGVRSAETQKSSLTGASHAESSGSLFEVSCSLAELYNDHVYDLLAPPEIVVQPFQLGGNNSTNVSGESPETRSGPKCDVKICKDGRTHVVGLTQHVVRDSREALQVFRDGAARRQVHSTLQNASSSRSHAIFTIYLSQRRFVAPNAREGRRAAVFRRLESKIVLVDLAGSERVGKSQSVGKRLREAQYINKSLSALGDVVAALSHSQSVGIAGGGVPASSASSTATGIAAHVPYRNNKLTALLQDAVGGRSKTILIACVAPCDPPFENHSAETLTTLQFAARVRCVRNVIQPLGMHGKIVSAATAPAASPRMDGVGERETAQATSSQPDSESEAGAKAVHNWMRATQSSKQRRNRFADANHLTGKPIEDVPPASSSATHSHYYRAPKNQDVKPRMRF